ncbi:warA [Symbiodinium sp. CCMP2456]|nr:warA [Symbiodinium sp. CCMP2456]
MANPSNDPAAVQVYAEEYNRLRQVDHASVQQVYWQHRQSVKRGPPTPMESASGTPMGDVQGGATGSGSQTTPQHLPPTLVHPFTVDDAAATQITTGLMGVDINQPQRVQEWLQAPVTTTQDVMKILRCYHKGVIRPELYNLVLQVETALRTVDDRVFQVKRELSWMASDNRQQQKNQSALQVLLSGFPAGLSPAQRQYMIGWMLMQVPEIKNFLVARGYVNDHTAAEYGRYFNGMHEELNKLCMSGPDNVHAEEPTLWAEQWNLVLWGPQRELD